MAVDKTPPRRPLLAGGEKLKTPADRSPGGGPKFHPVTIDEAYRALRPQALALAREVKALPEDVCGKHVVFEATIHPNYIANAYHPVSVLARSNFYVVGARRASAPYKTKAKETVAPTKSLLIAGERSGIASFAGLMSQPPDNGLVNWNEAREFREIALPTPSHVIRKMPETLGAGELVTWEAVLTPIGRTEKERATWGDEAFEKFVSFVRRLGGDVDVDYRRVVDGLSFVPVLLHREGVEDAARFNLLRSIRPMPKIRPVRPLRRSGSAAKPPDAPTAKRPATDLRVAIFDGGVNTKLPQFAPFVKVHHLTPEPPTDDDQSHGSMVTGAFLYGHIGGASSPLPQPVAAVDHYRVLPPPPGANIDHSVAWLLDQIAAVVETGKYRFVNLSVGPNEAVDEEDEPHQWTIRLDKLAKEHDVVFHCAVGNNGEDDAASGMNRVLVPGDMVNGIGVGACDAADGASKLDRAPYSAFGPGRYGLRTQPLGVAFGGRDHSVRPFIGIDHLGQLAMDAGTSYSTPLTMGGSVELAASLPAGRASARTIRAFVAHHAEPRARAHKINELGLGRLRRSYLDIWDCGEHRCSVLFEDELVRGEVVAMNLPFPTTGVPPTEPITLSWTITFLADTDPTDAFEYTCAGLELTFRPNARRVNVKDVRARKSLGVFDLVADAARLAQLQQRGPIAIGLPESGSWRRYRAEVQQREEGKWETVVRGSAKLSAGELFQPRLDINYLRRASGQLVSENVPPLDVSMLVTMQASPGVVLYDHVRTEYPILAPLAVVPLPLGST